jgi:hypothetical protein
MYRYIQNTSAIAVVSVALSLPMTAHAGGYGASAVRDSNVGNTTAGAKVPCPRLGQNVPANLAAQMDCGAATPRVAGERVRNTGGGLFGRHQIGSGPPANNDDDNPVTNVRDNTPPDDGDSPTNSGDTPTDGSDEPTDGGDGPTDGGGDFTSKTDRFNELGISFDDFANQSEDFHQSFDDFVGQNGPNGDWSSFNPPQ